MATLAQALSPGNSCGGDRGARQSVMQCLTRWPQSRQETQEHDSTKDDGDCGNGALAHYESDDEPPEADRFHSPPYEEHSVRRGAIIGRDYMEPQEPLPGSRTEERSRESHEEESEWSAVNDAPENPNDIRDGTVPERVG